MLFRSVSVPVERADRHAVSVHVQSVSLGISYLADIDKQAQERLLLLTKQIAEQENVTEQLKADNAMLWVQKMNEIQSRVREIIYNEIIYA